MILSSRIYQFKKDAIGPLPDEVTHLRAYSLDPLMPRVSKYGMEVNPDVQDVKPDKWQDWLDFVKERDLKVIWMVLTLKNGLNYDDQIGYIQEIEDYCGAGTVTGIQVGAEFWLPKYTVPRLDKKFAFEQVTTSDYLAMLGEYLPKLQSDLPGVKLYASCASFDDTSQTAARRQYDFEIIQYLNQNGFDDVGLTFHYYAGVKGIDGEEIVFDEIDWSFIARVKESTDRQIIIPESGFFAANFDEVSLNGMIDFYEGMTDVLDEGDIPGLHTLHQSKVSRLGWYSDAGITPVGQLWVDYFEDKEPSDEPYLVKFGPDYDSLDKAPLMFRQSYYLSNNKKGKTPWQCKWRNPVILKESHIGIPESELKKLFE